MSAAADSARYARLVQASGLHPGEFFRQCRIRALLRGSQLDENNLIATAELVALSAKYPRWPSYLEMPCCAFAAVLACPCGGLAVCADHGERHLGKTHE